MIAIRLPEENHETSALGRRANGWHEGNAGVDAWGPPCHQERCVLIKDWRKNGSDADDVSKN